MLIMCCLVILSMLYVCVTESMTDSSWLLSLVELCSSHFSLTFSFHVSRVFARGYKLGTTFSIRMTAIEEMD